MNRLYAITASVLLVIGIGITAASAEDPPCVPQEAWTEVIEHDAVTHEVHHDAEVIHHPLVPAVTRTEPGVWANWQPNETRGPQDYEPIWPTDERGTWNIHTQGVPPGHEGPDGVYQKGGGNSPWFYRQAERVIVVTPEIPAWDEVVTEAWTETVVDKEAWVETIQHPAVTCPPVEEPCPDDSLDPVTCLPTETPNPVDPVNDPEPQHEPEPEPKDLDRPSEPQKPVIPTKVAAGLPSTGA